MNSGEERINKIREEIREMIHDVSDPENPSEQIKIGIAGISHKADVWKVIGSHWAEPLEDVLELESGCGNWVFFSKSLDDITGPLTRGWTFEDLKYTPESSEVWRLMFEPKFISKTWRIVRAYRKTNSSKEGLGEEE